MMSLQVWKFTASTIHAHSRPEIVRFEKQLFSLDEMSRYLPFGAYTTFRTYEPLKVLGFSEHLTRLEETAAMSGYKVKLDAQLVRSSLRKILSEETPATELRIRIQIDLSVHPGDIYIAVEPFIYLPDRYYLEGAKAITGEYQRTNPRSKVSGFIQDSQHLRKQIRADINEVLLVNKKGNILEGLSSNFFGVIDGQVLTAGDEILHGITRSLVLAILSERAITVRFEAMHRSSIGDLQEAFISSSSRGILPIVEIDGIRIADGKPGAFTHSIMGAYRKKIALLNEEL